MPDDVANLVLEQLRMMRSQMDSMREEVRDGFAGVRQRLDAMETELRGVSYIMTVSVGSILAEVKDLKVRMDRVEAPV